MAKKQMQHIKTCAECIHENACRAWVDGRYIADESADRCPNYETVKESGAYLCGVLDERKRKKTRADKIRAMSDEELADIISREVGYCAPSGYCEKTSNDCKACWLDWLQQPAEEGE